MTTTGSARGIAGAIPSGGGPLCLGCFATDGADDDAACRDCCLVPEDADAATDVGALRFFVVVAPGGAGTTDGFVWTTTFDGFVVVAIAVLTGAGFGPVGRDCNTLSFVGRGTWLIVVVGRIGSMGTAAFTGFTNEAGIGAFGLGTPATVVVARGAVVVDGATGLGFTFGTDTGTVTGTTLC